MNHASIKVFTTGYCMALERVAINNGKWKNIKFHATCILIEHPTKGLILFDTGYTPRFSEATQKWPSRLYELSTPVVTKWEWSVKAQLKKSGIAPSDISTIIISHFHADHIAGLKDFENATFWCTKTAYEEVSTLKGFAAVRRGLLPSLLPDDFKSNVRFFEEELVKRDRSDFNYHFTFSDDDILKIIPLPGHARGQIGLLLNEGKENPYLLAADAYWLIESVQHNILPAKIINTFIDNWEDYKSSLQNIRTYLQQHPETISLSCHCNQVYENWVEKIY